MVGRQPYAPAAFTPGEIIGTHFQRLRRPQGTWFCRKEPRKKSTVTPPRIVPGTVRLVAQRLNHYATPGPVALHNCHINNGQQKISELYVCILQSACNLTLNENMCQFTEQSKKSNLKLLWHCQRIIKKYRCYHKKIKTFTALPSLAKFVEPSKIF